MAEPGAEQATAPSPLRTPLLFVTVMIVATSGLVYELLAGAYSSYVLGDSVRQFSTTIGVYLFAKKSAMRVSGKELGTLAVLGVMYSLSAHFLFVGYDYMSAGVASTILFLYPVFVALIMGLFFREKLSWVMWGFSSAMIFNACTMSGQLVQVSDT